MEEARRILEKKQLRVVGIASPLFKTDSAGSAAVEIQHNGRSNSNQNFTFDQQGDVLERSLALAETLKTDRLRCFDFWRLDDSAPHRAAMNEVLRRAAEEAGHKEQLS